MADQTNPMRDLLQKQLGIDAFALDGDAAQDDDSWMDEARPQPAARPEILEGFIVRSPDGLVTIRPKDAPKLTVQR